MLEPLAYAGTRLTASDAVRDEMSNFFTEFPRSIVSGSSYETQTAIRRMSHSLISTAAMSKSVNRGRVEPQ